MALELKQGLRLSQQLVMTPQLQQAIKLLQLSRLELVDLIRSEMEQNPLLEEPQDGAEAELNEAPAELVSTLNESIEASEIAPEAPRMGIEAIPGITFMIQAAWARCASQPQPTNAIPNRTGPSRDSNGGPKTTRKSRFSSSWRGPGWIKREAIAVGIVGTPGLKESQYANASAPDTEWSAANATMLATARDTVTQGIPRTFASVPMGSQ